MTGHLLLTSLHANDALASIARLETLGCNRELIAQSVSLVLVQRLVRRVCPACAKMERPAPILAESLAALRNGIREVCLPRENKRDLDELPPAPRRLLPAHLISDAAEVLDLALRREPASGATAAS